MCVGQEGDIPVPFDYFDEGHCRLATFRPSTGEWLIKVPNLISFLIFTISIPQDSISSLDHTGHNLTQYTHFNVDNILCLHKWNHKLWVWILIFSNAPALTMVRRAQARKIGRRVLGTLWWSLVKQVTCRFPLISLARVFRASLCGVLPKAPGISRYFLILPLSSSNDHYYLLLVES